VGKYKTKVMSFLSAFHQEDVQLERIYQLFMVLIPKRTGAVAEDTFLLICLQNCSIEILAKILTRGLQKQIGNLIELSQIGFLQGRSICETCICC